MLNTSSIDNILNEFLKQFELTAFAGTDFGYYPSTNRIEYAFVTPVRMDNLFLSFAKSIGLSANIDSFLFSCLHEIGHHETIDEISDEEYEYCHQVKEILTDSDKDCNIYFNLPDEYAATSWAINFINSHSAEVSDLWSRLQPAIMNFYASNDIH